jgi:excisionase family DNA binding protein
MQSKQAWNGPQWLTVGEAASLVGVSTDTIKRYEKRGLIASERTPTGHRRFHYADVKLLLQPSHEGAAS